MATKPSKPARASVPTRRKVAPPKPSQSRTGASGGRSTAPTAPPRRKKAGTKSATPATSPTRVKTIKATEFNMKSFTEKAQRAMEHRERKMKIPTEELIKPKPWKDHGGWQEVYGPVGELHTVTLDEGAFRYVYEWAYNNYVRHANKSYFSDELSDVMERAFMPFHEVMKRITPKEAPRRRKKTSTTSSTNSKSTNSAAPTKTVGRRKKIIK